MSAALIRSLQNCLPSDRVAIDRASLRANSSDYHWFSNVLEEELRDCSAEVVVWPENTQELADVLSAAYSVGVPVTLRGGGTGNYGQCVPLEGGLVVSFGRMNDVVEIGDGYARVEPGITFAQLDRVAFAGGQEARIFPSTYRTGTVAGFLAGGSMGVGSVTHGTVTDGNVLSVTVWPLTDSPAPRGVNGPEIARYLHSYGTTGVIAEVTVPLAPRGDWEQGVVSFDDFWACHAFCLELLQHAAIEKRMITGLDEGVVHHYQRANLGFRDDRPSAMLLYAEDHRERVAKLAGRHRGELDFTLPGDAKKRLFEFSWNHSTLWAKKADSRLTYLQAGLAAEQSDEQLRAIRREYPRDFSMHNEYVLWGGQPFVVMLPIFRYGGRQHVERMISFFEGIDALVANPHTFVLEEGSQVDVDALLATKRANDPAGLLNPGKLASASGDKRRTVFGEKATMGLGQAKARS